MLMHTEVWPTSTSNQLNKIVVNNAVKWTHVIVFMLMWKRKLAAFKRKQTYTITIGFNVWFFVAIEQNPTAFCWIRAEIL